MILICITAMAFKTVGDHGRLLYNPHEGGDAYDCPRLIWKSNKDKGGKIP